LHVPVPAKHPAVQKARRAKSESSQSHTVYALDDLSAIQTLAVDLATLAGRIYRLLYHDGNTDNYLAAKGTVMIAIDLTSCSIGLLPSHGVRRVEQEVSLTQYELAAAPNISHRPDRHVVTVEVTVYAWTADEAAQVVRAFVTDVFARSDYKLGNVHAINAEQPGDETWHRALDCAGALG
jgi:hypothetical protein